MPTTDERREVAARLREMARTFSWLNHVSLERAIGVDTDGYSFKESDAIVCNRLADLIEPEPERTCGEWRGDRGSVWGQEDDLDLWCEHCDIRLEEGWVFCPNCGAKVVSE